MPSAIKSVPLAEKGIELGGSCVPLCREQGETGRSIKSEVGYMRHNQNGRRFRGRNNNNGNGGGQNHHHHNNGGHRRINPRVQTFDSNGPDVRIRGNAMQIAEKYLTLARDAQGAGDRVLAESYLQHAEHYQRMLNEANEEYNRQQAQFQQQNPHHRSHQSQDDMMDDEIAGSGEQPEVPLEDLDQGFLVGRRNVPVQQSANSEINGNLNVTASDDSVEVLSDAEEAPAQPVVRRRAAPRVKESEAV